MPSVRTGPLIGLIAQVVLLMVVAATVGLGVVGWVTGFAYGVTLCALLARGLNRSSANGFGPANSVTLTRATLVGAVTALTADSFVRPGRVEALVAIAVVALVLDAVDGLVARRTSTASGLGARFDMEVDAFLILVLSVYVARSMGAWVLAIGAMRYAWVAATWVSPWLRGALPPRYWRKVVAAIQGIVLTFATADILPRAVTVVAVLGALGLLTESFGRDVVWRWRHRGDLPLTPVPPGPQPSIPRPTPAPHPRPSTNPPHPLDRPRPSPP